jgi:hypothetical protein
MAFTAHSLNHDAIKGTSGVQVNGYALVADLGLAEGDTAALVANASTALTGTLSSTTTAVTGSGTAFDTELVVGSLISINGSDDIRQVTAIASATALTVNAAFDTDLSADSAVVSEAHVSTVAKVASFQGLIYFEKSLAKDFLLADTPFVIKIA